MFVCVFIVTDHPHIFFQFGAFGMIQFSEEDEQLIV